MDCARWRAGFISFFIDFISSVYGFIGLLAVVWCRYGLGMVLVLFWCGMVLVWLLHGAGVDWVRLRYGSRTGSGMVVVWFSCDMVWAWLRYGCGRF